MLSVGNNIQSKDDKLQKVPLDYLANSLAHPKPNIEARINQLRIIRELDPKKYSQQKRLLPYLVCAHFNPPYRKTENFAYTEYFIVDIDHISEKDMDMASLREKLCKDPFVRMLFTSPGQDGLKLIFQLKERCYDAGLYSSFYKAFLKKFSSQYDLMQVVDTKTSDVARACFISMDKDVYFNPFSELVDLSQYVELSNPVEAIDLKHDLDKEAKLNEKANQEEREKEPEKEIMKKIKAQLQLQKKKINDDIPVYVPQELDALMEGLKNFIEENGVLLTGIKNIQYAKKLNFELGMKKAEINVFYGKHGFKVVQSPKSGTSSDLNQLVADMIQTYIDNNA